MPRVRDLLTNRGRAFIGAGSTLVLTGVALGFLDLTRLGVLLLGLPLMCSFLARRYRLTLSVQRTARPARVQIDEPSTVTVTVRNTGPRTLPFLIAEEQLDYSLGDRPRFVIPGVRRDQDRRVTYSVRSHTRGRHRLGPLGIRIRDPFGLTMRSAQVRGVSEVLVVPRVLPLSSDRPPGSGVGAEGVIPHMVALSGEDDVSIREYRDGDDLRRIHWPSTARSGELMVRQEDRPARRRAVLLLDSRKERHRGTGNTASYEWAVTACASIGVHLIERRYAVHLLTDETTAEGQVVRAFDIDEVLDTLAVADLHGPQSFDAVLHAAHPAAGSGGLVVAVVAPLDDDHARALAALRQPGGTALALVLDVDSFSGRRDPSAEPSAVCLGTVSALRAAGWRALAVTSTTSVPQAWAAVSGGHSRHVSTGAGESALAGAS